MFKRTVGVSCSLKESIDGLEIMYEQQIFIDEIQVYSRRHIQLSSTRAHLGGQPNIFCFALFHWSQRFSELFPFQAIFLRCH
jgi:hypothetical protein